MGVIAASLMLLFDPEFDGLPTPAAQAANLHGLWKLAQFGQAADVFHGTPEKSRDLFGIDQRGRAERGGGLGHGNTLEGPAVSCSPRKTLLGPPVIFMGTTPPE
jgi:hypothetical protein